MMKLLFLFVEDNDYYPHRNVRMVVETGNKAAIKKMFRHVARHKESYGVSKGATADYLLQQFELYGTGRVSNMMQYGSIEFVRTGEVINN